ncbi:hypothetical protein [Enterovibrio nigricans]|uniref:Uncharacterized protein n=1 Tax=Enterovibrio nigricans DSM 22720 TaxID=1121868 RepID=A0A1T4WBI0_9GAMM|nr:hypothetical protein [Enterovibrio nigricans]PKF48747.1 hypothetical protein AT251_23910 [Enterovibrio nigricans]SKA74643.1 hypothetical protein SAMN02745132_04862 [Enterovibrio nigricans DSM 22720]
MEKFIKLADPNLAVASEIFEAITEAFKKSQCYRTSTFFKTVETRYEVMTQPEKVKFKEHISSESGQKVISDFAIAVSSTPSTIVNASLALLYSQDPDFNFSQNELERFVAAVSGLTDRKVDFLLHIQNLSPSQKESLYPVYVINQDNFGTLRDVIDIDELFIYVSDFQSRGLVLINVDQPKNFGFANKFDDGVKWSTNFCLSETQVRYIALLRKAKELVA